MNIFEKTFIKHRNLLMEHISEQSNVDSVVKLNTSLDNLKNHLVSKNLNFLDFKTAFEKWDGDNLLPTLISDINSNIDDFKYTVSNDYEAIYDWDDNDITNVLLPFMQLFTSVKKTYQTVRQGIESDDDFNLSATDDKYLRIVSNPFEDWK